MWTLSTLWNHPADGFEHLKLELVGNCEPRPKEFEIIKTGVEKDVDLGFEIIYFLLPSVVL